MLSFMQKHLEIRQ